MAGIRMQHARALAGSSDFSPLDRRFAEFIAVREGTEDPYTYLAALAASRATAGGSICAHLPALAGKSPAGTGDDEAPGPRYPALAEWKKRITGNPAVGKPGEYAPLIIDGCDRVYLYRYWRYEHDLAANIRARLDAQPDPGNAQLLRQGLDRLFGPAMPGEINWQKIAALNAVASRFSVISGGPGTGKSRTVARILALISERALSEGKDISIALCAPTGKAAARLQESIAQARGEMQCAPEIIERMPDASYTIHRLLGAMPGTPYFRHDAKNPLPHDIVVVDESSMADLALMAKLADAVRPDARLVLLGDRDQLSSVEAGAVLGDICDTGRKHAYSARFVELAAHAAGEDLSAFAGDLFGPSIADSIVILKKSFRFGSGIGALAAAVREGDAKEALDLLDKGRFGDVELIEPVAQDLAAAMRVRSGEGAFAFRDAETPEAAFTAYARFTVLCALRKGAHGVEGVNALVERELGQSRYAGEGGRNYAGRPIMITRNDHPQRLYNGDVGIIMRAGSGIGAPTAAFRSDDGGFRFLSPVRLPEHDTVYAMTVHKSQGSEFRSIMLVLPESLSPVLTRELVYTAITRARERVLIWGSKRALAHAIQNPVSRASGLRDMLWG
jgi:exodeoxyribonuclease V alpha subunit